MIWILSGALTGLLMGLWEYFFLAITAEAFSNSTELMVFVSGLVTGLVFLGGILGCITFLLSLFFKFIFKRFVKKHIQDVRRLQRLFEYLRSKKWPLIAIGCLGWTGVSIGFLLNALMYHRLYLYYHGVLSCLTFLSGFIGSLSLMLLARRKVEPSSVFRLRIIFAAFSLTVLVGLFTATPRLVWNENLKAIVADRGVTSAQIFMVIRTFFDRDGDGFARPPFGYDCDDNDPRRHPMRYDIPGDGIDQNCTGADRRPPRPLPPPPSESHPYDGPKRIIIITIESLRADRWPGYTKRELLPNVYKLSRLGFAFHRAYATSNWTIPSVYSLMTGRYPSHVKFVMGMLDQKDNVALIDPESRFARDRRNMRKLIPVPATDTFPTLAEELKKRGFTTATVIDIPFLKREMGMARGFDIVDETPYLQANKSLAGITSPLMAQRGLEIIRKHRKDRLFLYLHFSDPHAPYHKHATPTDLGDSAKDRYDSEIRFVDNWIGYILSNLQKDDLLRDTLFVITSDHGQEFYDHGGLYHATTVYEELIRVPLVFAGPGIGRRATIQPVSLVDVFPTVLSLVDSTQGRDLGCGADLSGWLRTGQVPRTIAYRPAVYAESRRFHNWKQAVISNRYKLIRDNKAGTSMLFDLHRDPKETRNLIGQKPELARTLLGKMYEILNN